MLNWEVDLWQQTLTITINWLQCIEHPPPQRLLQFVPRSPPPTYFFGMAACYCYSSVCVCVGGGLAVRTGIWLALLAFDGAFSSQGGLNFSSHVATRS